MASLNMQMNDFYWFKNERIQYWNRISSIKSISVTKI